MGIDETLCQALAKIVMRAVGGQANMVWGKLQLCAGLKAGIERATHAIGQRTLKRSRQRRILEVAGYVDKEEENENLAACLHNLTIETSGTEEEAVEGLKVEL